MAEVKKHSRFHTVIDPVLVDRIKQLVLASQEIVITCHVSPDGDALGSSTALCMVLKNLNKRAHVVTADCPPKSLYFLPGVRDIVIATRQTDRAHELLGSADLIFCLDYNDPKRIDRLSDALLRSKARKVMIDHHLDPCLETDVAISNPEISSTSALLYLFLWQAGWTDILTAVRQPVSTQV